MWLKSARDLVERLVKIHSDLKAATQIVPLQDYVDAVDGLLNKVTIA